MLQEINQDLISYYLAGTLFVALLVLAIISYIILHQRKVNAFQVRLKQEELLKQQAIFIALKEGEAQERKRLSEELHDGVGAKLSGVKMKLDYLNSQLEDESLKKIIAEAYLVQDESIIELRAISHNLYSEQFIDKDLRSAVLDLINQLDNWASCKFTLFYDLSENIVLGVALKLNCYRIVTELAYNILKHSQATTASVQLSSYDQVLQIITIDNGVGYDINRSSEGLGLKNLSSRVKSSMGTMNVDTSKSGTTTIIEIPL